MMEIVCVDVSLLAPPEPMTCIITALSKLQPTQYLKVIHRREPFPLYEKLQALDWQVQTFKQASDVFHIYIYRLDMQSEFAAYLAEQPL